MIFRRRKPMIQPCPVCGDPTRTVSVPPNNAAIVRCDRDDLTFYDDLRPITLASLVVERTPSR